MEEFKEQIIRAIKVVFKHFRKILLIPIIAVIIIIILLATSLYVVTKDDAKHKDDWTSTGYGAEIYQSGVTVNEDGTISSGQSAQEIWDKLVESGSSVADYLSGPEALGKLMNAQVVTNYPDTRSNVEEPIDWDSIDFVNGTTTQGIVKFRRADQNGNKSYMTYVDPSTFYGWVEQYNTDGNETAKQNALTHFTIAQTSGGSSSSGTGVSGTGGTGISTDVSDAIVEAVWKTPTTGPSTCLMWVDNVYVNAGLTPERLATATVAYQAHYVSDNVDEMPVGASVYANGNSYAGHIGIYIGEKEVDGVMQKRVVDNHTLPNGSEVKEWEFNEWCSYYGGFRGWGWEFPNNEQPNIIEEDSSNEEDEILNDSSSNSDTSLASQASKYSVVVATWSQEDITVTTDDPNVDAYSRTNYTMQTRNIDYQSMISKYTLHFDLLWAFLVIGQSENFVLEWSDLAYNSEIEVTVYDNYTKNTDIDNWTYNYYTENHISATATAGSVSLSNSFVEGIDNIRNTVKTVVTQTNTIDVAVTKANVWIVDFETEYEYKQNPEQTTTQVNNVEDEPKPEAGGTYSTNSYNSPKINALADRAISQAQAKGETVTQASLNINVTSYSWYKDIVDDITHKTESSKYISKPGTLTEKVDESTEPNFVTIFNKPEYEHNKSSILSADQWLFEIIEENDYISNNLDLIKYLLYKATNTDYGVTEFDFNQFYPDSLTSVGSNDYIVNIDKSSEDIVITDIETLKKAFAGYPTSSKLIENAQQFLDLQEEYRVNAIFAAAVSVSETTAGTAGHAVNGKNNWFNIECTCGNSSHGRFETYSSPKESIEAFYKQIAVKNYYFTDGNYTVRSIGMIYCEDADAPGGWIDTTLSIMTQMFNAAGIDVSAVTGNGDFLDIAKQCHDYVRLNGFHYGNGNIIPTDESGSKQIDCSAYVTWVLYEYGYTDLRGYQQSTRTLLGLAKRKGWTVKPGSEAVAGDIVLNPNSHTSIYAGNGQFYDCGSTSLIQSEITTYNPGYQYAITVTKP